MTTNNEYYKTIYEKVNSTTVSEIHSDNWYLERIAEKICDTTYSVTKCNGKYLKDIAEAVTEDTYSEHHFNNFYLHKWAEEVTGEELPMNFDNYFLGLIANGIAPSISFTLELSTQSPVIYNDMYINVILLDENRQPIEDGIVTVSDGDEFEETDSTNSEGKFTSRMLYAPQTLGEVQITATYQEYTVTATLNVRKVHTSLTIDATPSTVPISSSSTISGDIYEENDTGGVLSIQIWCNDEYVTSVMSDASGHYTYQASQSTIGTYTYKTKYVSEDDWEEGCESSEVTVTFIDAPVPVPSSIDLTGTKSILSYADSESSVLTATVLDDNDDPVEGVSVDLYKDSVLWDTLTTGSAGTVSKTYTSAGIGDVSFKAECGSLVTETYTIQDMFKYDDATTNKSNKFSFISNPVSASISHQTDHYAVSYSRTPEGNPVKINLAEFVCDGDFEASMDILYTSSGSKQWTWKISGNSTFAYENMSEIGSWSTSRILRTFEGGTSHSTNPSSALPTNTWLTLKFKKQNGNILLQIYNGSSLLNEYSSTGWTVSTNIIMGLQMSEQIYSMYFKNLQIKKL